MNSIKKTIQKISGIRKQYKPGQLITIDNCVFRVVKNRSGLPDCWVCNLDLDQASKYCKYCMLYNGLQDCYLKLVK